MNNYFEPIKVQIVQFPMTGQFRLKTGLCGRKVRWPLAALKEALIGKDTRSSGYSAGVRHGGGLACRRVNVALVGVLPTPGIAYLTSTFRADAGGGDQRLP